ncbi:MAG TPA: ATP-binding protein [Actinomycetota bacterium]|nr:ATP-binding protein [Actinomycetota bacterium]
MAEDAFRVPSGSQSRRARVAAWTSTPEGRLAAVLLAAAAAWTLLILASPRFSFSFRWPRARLPIETAGLVVAGLAAALAYLRYTLDGARASLLVAVAFLALAANRLVFGVVLGPSSLGSQDAVYAWTAGRLAAGILLLAAALPGSQVPATRARPLLDLARTGGAALAALAGLHLALWLARDGLPALFSPEIDPALLTGPHPGLTGFAVGLGAVGTSLYLVAAAAHLGSRHPEVAGTSSLAPALVLAAFSHLHYTLLPTVFSPRISTGDLLRVTFSALLLLGLARDVRRTYLAERERGRQLAAAFEAERERVRELEELDRSRAELFGIVTHELVHPVAAIRGWALTLARRWDELGEEGRREAIARLDAEAVRLRDLAEDAARLPAFEAGAFHLALRDEEVRALVEEAVASSPGLRERLAVEVEEEAAGARVRADRARLLQVFRNLFSNALRHAGPDPEVRLTVRAAPEEVVFTVADDGPGIPPGEAERLFRPFARGPKAGEAGTAAGGPGAGLGLYICRRIVEAHGGRIWAEDHRARGAAFSFALPRTEARP